MNNSDYREQVTKFGLNTLLSQEEIIFEEKDTDLYGMCYLIPIDEAMEIFKELDYRQKHDEHEKDDDRPLHYFDCLGAVSRPRPQSTKPQDEPESVGKERHREHDTDEYVEEAYCLGERSSCGYICVCIARVRKRRNAP